MWCAHSNTQLFRHIFNSLLTISPVDDKGHYNAGVWCNKVCETCDLSQTVEYGLVCSVLILWYHAYVNALGRKSDWPDGLTILLLCGNQVCVLLVNLEDHFWKRVSTCTVSQRLWFRDIPTHTDVPSIHFHLHHNFAEITSYSWLAKRSIWHPEPETVSGGETGFQKIDGCYPGVQRKGSPNAMSVSIVKWGISKNVFRLENP